MNASVSSAAPTAVAMPTSGTNGCAGASNALTYNTSTHALGCNSISGGSGVTPAPPYWTDGTYKYDAQGYKVTLPPSSSSWLNSLAPTTWTAQTNGDVLVIGTVASDDYWQTQSLTTSIEYVGIGITQLTTGNNTYESNHGIWVYDSTNGVVYTWIVQDNSNVSGGTGPPTYLVENKYTYTGTGLPTYVSQRNAFIAGGQGWAAPVHLRIRKSGTTLYFGISMDGGVSFVEPCSETVGTLSSGGVHFFSQTGNAIPLDIYSLAVN
jgi:hypothetical protein